MDSFSHFLAKVNELCGKICYNNAMDASFKDKIGPFFTVTLVAITIIGGIALAYPSYKRCQSLKRQDAQIKSEIMAKKEEIAKLLEYQHRFKSDRDFVENIARRNRRVFPGELVFIFED